jgi:hypothetical protein
MHTVSNQQRAQNEFSISKAASVGMPNTKDEILTTSTLGNSTTLGVAIFIIVSCGLLKTEQTNP